MLGKHAFIKDAMDTKVSKAAKFSPYADGTGDGVVIYHRNKDTHLSWITSFILFYFLDAWP